MSYRSFLASLLVLSIQTMALAGPVNVTAQTRSVHVLIPSIVDGEPAIDETVAAPDFGPFDQTLDRTLNQLEQTNHAVASQVSSFGETGDVFSANAQGSTSYSATGLEGIVQSDSNFSLQFTLDDTRDYNISGAGSFPDTGAGASNFAVTLTGPGGTVATFTKADFNPNNNDGAIVNAPFATSGTLTPGDYTLTALSGVSGGTNLTEIAATYQVAFTAMAQGDGGGGGGTPIPLPAGVAPGGVMLAGLALFAARKRLVPQKV